MDPEKKIPIFTWFYELGDVYLTVSVKDNPKILLPPHLLVKELETFVVGAIPTPDLSYDNSGIMAPMRFGPNFFSCFFSWDSIVSMGGAHAVIQFFNQKTGEQGDVNGSSDKKKGIESGEKEKTPKQSQKSHLRVVK
jgi:hypothetical protein